MAIGWPVTGHSMAQPARRTTPEVRRTFLLRAGAGAGTLPHTLTGGALVRRPGAAERPGLEVDMADRRVWIAGAAFLAAWALVAAPAFAQWQVESDDGKASVKFGLLAQPQLETLETADHQDTSVNLFIRRVRLLVGGSVSERWSFFLETDSPNLGKGNPNTGATSGVKDAGDMYLQDAYVTYTQHDGFKIDAGMLLLPHSETARSRPQRSSRFSTTAPTPSWRQARSRPRRARLRHPAARLPGETAPGIPACRGPGRSRHRGPQPAAHQRAAGLLPVRRRNRFLLRGHLPGGRRSRRASAPASTPRRTSGSTPPTGSSSGRPPARPRGSPCRSTGCGMTAAI